MFRLLGRWGRESSPSGKRGRFALVALIATWALAGCGAAKMAEIRAVTPLPRADAIARMPVSTPAIPVESAVPSETPGLGLTNDGTAIAVAATPAPLDNDLPAGSAAAIAAATDAILAPTIEARLVFEESPVRLRFDEFYDGYNIRTGLLLSDKLRSLDGMRVEIEGYMAPPLKPALDFFVLTRVRLAFCPFCTTAAEWPDDIALVYLNDKTITSTSQPLRLTGRLELGPMVDAETGMVSIVRIYADSWELL